MKGIHQSPPTRCVGRNDTCQRDARPGHDLCGPCNAALPRCAECGHHVNAHNPDDPYDGACTVNHHETASGPLCGCPGYVHPDELDDGGL